MKIQVDGTTYHVTFRNVSEKVVHDAMPPGLTSHLAASGVLEVVPDSNHPKSNFHFRLKASYRTFLKLKPPKRISTTTTICAIATDQGAVLTTGKAFCSSIEPVFDRGKARRKALGRAVRELFTSTDREKFLTAYATELHARQLKARRSNVPPTSTDKTQDVAHR